MAVYTVGYDTRLAYARDRLVNTLGDCSHDVHLLPIPTSRDGEYITGTGTVLRLYLKRLRENDVLVCYGLDKSLADELSERGVNIVELSHDEEYLCEGAYLTALGTVGYLLENCDTALCDMSVGVIGLGRIGARLCDMLLSLGCSIVAFSSKQSPELDARGARIYGYQALSSGKIPKLDALINTAPAPLVKASLLAELNGAPVLELASGDNLPKDMSIVRLPALPARAFKKSAGYSVARAVLRALAE